MKDSLVAEDDVETITLVFKFIEGGILDKELVVWNILFLGLLTIVVVFFVGYVSRNEEFKFLIGQKISSYKS